MKLLLRLIFVCIVLVPAALLPRSADAVPVFARKYKTACTTCHWSAFPKLNAFGYAFRARNYRIPPEDEIYIKEDPVSMGVEAYKKVFPDAVWPSDIPHLPAFSIITATDFTVRPRNRAGDAENWFNGIGEVEFLSAGTLGESFSWFAAMALNEASNRGFDSSTEIERMYWQYTPRFFGWEPGTVAVRVGVFETRAAPFRDHIRLTVTPSMADRFAIVPTGNFHRLHKEAGLEIFGAHNGPGGRGGIRWSFGVVNGIAGAFGRFTSNANGYDATQISDFMSGNNAWGDVFDLNNNKDVYARINYKIGGMGVLGGVEEVGLGSEKNWQDDSLTLGAFFYRGNAPYLTDPVNQAGFHENGNRFWRFGGEVRLDYWNFSLKGGATFYRDNPAKDITIGGKSGDDFDADIYTFIADYVAWPWLIPSIRVEHVDPDYDTGDWPSLTRFSTDLTFLLRANIKARMGGSVTGGDWDGQRPTAFDDEYHMSMDVAF